MLRFKLKDFTRGWFIGNFEPSVLRQELFEVGLLQHSKGEHWPKHFQKIATEYNVLVEGSMEINGEKILPGDIFIVEPLETIAPIFLEDCKVLVIKTPSIPSDKYLA
jgi:hypothetical protein